MDTAHSSNSGNFTVKTSKTNASLHVTDSGNSTVEGMRFKNPRFHCFLNTAINAVVTNEILMHQLLKENTVMKWGEEILLTHDPDFVEGTRNTYRDVLNALTVLNLDSVGCSENHGLNCFVSVQNQIQLQLLKSKVLDELKRLVFEESGIRDASRLKNLLSLTSL